MKTTQLLLAGVPFAFILAGCSGSKAPQHGQDTISVHAIKLNGDSLAVSTKIIYNGTLQANKVIDLSFQISGTINSLPVNTGDYVRKGQLVGTVDETTYRNQYNAQLAQAKIAEENYKRILTVFEKGSVAEIKMLEAKSNFDQATSTARATYQNIAHSRLIAPQDGYIGDKKTEAGAIASPGQTVLQLLDTRSVNVLVAIPENEINKYKSGEHAVVYVDAMGKRPMDGRISEIGVLALNNSANYNLKVRLTNPEKDLRPGMLCKVSFQPSSVATAKSGSSKEIVVPIQAVQVDEAGRNYVYVIDEGRRAQRKDVKTGTLYDNSMAINSGLTGTEELIISGYQKLADHSPVIVKQ
jgi:membrane fusion protein (multidrug efflux system)